MVLKGAQTILIHRINKCTHVPGWSHVSCLTLVHKQFCSQTQAPFSTGEFHTIGCARLSPCNVLSRQGQATVQYTWAVLLRVYIYAFPLKKKKMVTTICGKIVCETSTHNVEYNSELGTRLYSHTMTHLNLFCVPDPNKKCMLLSDIITVPFPSFSERSNPDC